MEINITLWYYRCFCTISMSLLLCLFLLSSYTGVNSDQTIMMTVSTAATAAAISNRQHTCQGQILNILYRIVSINAILNIVFPGRYYDAHVIEAAANWK